MKLSVINAFVIFVTCKSLKMNIIYYSSALCTLGLEILVALMLNVYLFPWENN